MSSEVRELIAELRQSFVAELPERFDEIEDLALAFEQGRGDQEGFNTLFRHVHSVKGAGGTYGLHILTTICHNFEDRLNEEAQKVAAGGAYTTANWLIYADLLRRALRDIQDGSEDFTAIKTALDDLRRDEAAVKLPALLVLDSISLEQLCLDVWSEFPVAFTVVRDGYEALGRLIHETYDVVICNRELPGLGGEPLIAALRLSKSPSRNAATVLLTSRDPRLYGRDTDPDFCVRKDGAMITNMRQLAAEVVKRSRKSA